MTSKPSRQYHKPLQKVKLTERHKKLTDTKAIQSALGRACNNGTITHETHIRIFDEIWF